MRENNTKAVFPDKSLKQMMRLLEVQLNVRPTKTVFLTEVSQVVGQEK